MTDDDRSFYGRRMQEEQEKAAAAQDTGLRYLHSQWAKLYEARLNGR